MSALFGGDDVSDGELKINKDYANNYDTWRQKEELNKLKTKYGENAINLEESEDESSSSSDEDEDENELSKQFDKEFYKTLACLKKKDPSIYNEGTTFFNNTSKDQAKEEDKTDKVNGKTKKEKALTLRDYERKIITERNGELSESEDEDTFLQKKNIENSQTYVEEQRQLKESFKTVLVDDEEEENNFLRIKEKTEKDQEQEETAYKEWLKGQRSTIDAKEEEELKPLREFWADPDLDANEKFLRDYILNNKFLDRGISDDDPDYEHVAHDSDKDLSEDERNIEQQEEFEHKYNFRFEEPDQDFLKRYPRTMENSMRKKDTRRSEKRAEVRQRKQEEKVRKQEELKQLKALKRKEIKDKIEQLKEITGNDDIRIDGIDLDAEFNPAEHDQKMTEIFNDEYYSVPEDVKPEFPDIDGELGIETTWDNYDPENEEFVPDTDNYNEPHCEDPEFNMDADYNPTATLQEELIDSTKKKKRRRRSKFAELIATEKPKFDPQQHPSYQEYYDQYYSLDYEDMIGDLPCRFKYRKVVPNDYGLSVEEILMADDKELNKWCSLKRALQYRPEHAELNDVRQYQQKANNETLKRKVLKSLFKTEETSEEDETPNTSSNTTEQSETVKKRKQKKKKKKNKSVNAIENSVDNISNKDVARKKEEKQSSMSDQTKKQKKAVKRKRPDKTDDQANSNLKENGETPTKNTTDEPPAKKLKEQKTKEKGQQKNKKKNKKQNVLLKGAKQVASMNAERLKTYGLNAKKLKNKLIYGKKKE